MTTSTEHRSRDMAAVKLPSRNYIEECQKRTYLSCKEKLTVQENLRPYRTRKPGNDYQNEGLTRPYTKVNVGVTSRDSQLSPTRRTALGTVGSYTRTTKES